jgi:hypothetical protein
VGNSCPRSSYHANTTAGLWLYRHRLRHGKENQIHQSCWKCNRDPPHLVSGSSCTSYQGTRNLSAKTYHSILNNAHIILRRALQSSIYAVILVSVTLDASAGVFIDLWKPTLSTPSTPLTTSTDKDFPSSPLVKGMLNMGIAVSTTKAESVTVTQLCPGLVCGMTVRTR